MKKIPSAIMSRLLLLTGCVTLVLIIGTAWSIVVRDAISLYLTIILVILGTLKIYGIYRDAREHRYEVHEGVLISKRFVPGRKQEELQLLRNEELVTIILSGKHSFVVGQQYRLYIQRRDSGDIDLPQMLKPGCTLLGYEAIPESTCK